MYVYEHLKLLSVEHAIGPASSVWSALIGNALPRSQGGKALS